ncbi:MAG: DUF4185 domain-containing protein [Sedimentisphaerales bacterium]
MNVQIRRWGQGVPAVKGFNSSESKRHLLSFVLIVLFVVLSGAKAANVLTNPGFESGTTGWSAMGTCSINTVTSSPSPHSGSYCGHAYNRTATWNGIAQDVTNEMMSVGQTYQMSGWVRIDSNTSDTVKMTVKKTDGSGTTYVNVATVTADNSKWVSLSGNYTLTVNGTLTSLLVYFETTTSATNDIYVDDVNVSAPDYITISTHAKKICQIIGDWDKEVNEPTVNLTGQRYNLPKTDLGSPFTHNGRTYLLFGDTWSSSDDDPIAFSYDTNLEGGLSLTFLQNPNGSYKPVTIPGISLGSFEVPMEGVSVNGKMYIYATTDHTSTVVMGRSVLAISNDDGNNFSYLYDFSTNYFINVSVVKVNLSDWHGFPQSTDQGLVIFGSGLYRQSDVRLAFQPAAQIESSGSRRYFSGLVSGQPTWSVNESNAVALFNQPVVGELSVSYNKFIRKWIMLYNAPDPYRGIDMRTADNPWGPWSDPPQIIFDPWNNGGYCHFMHTSWDFENCDSVSDPGREHEWGGEYGPYQFQDLATGNLYKTTIYFTMSTWNPYTVVLMKAVLKRIYPDQCELVDYDINKIINFEDYAKFAQYWLDGELLGDLTQDGIIDLSDLQYFCSCWLHNINY